MPVYGNTTLHGQSVSNAFFWAISRSQDMTLVHDWLPSSGQGYGTEYRYIRGPGADGNFRFYRLSEKATADRPERQSFEVRANAIQRLPGNLSAKANIDYFSDVTVQQSYQMDFYNATLRNRTYGGNLAGAWGRNNASFTYDQNEVFYGTDNSLTVGARPRISYRLSPTPIIGNSLFFTASSEYAALSRVEKFGTSKNDFSLSRYDVTPAIQFPFTALAVPDRALVAGVAQHLLHRGYVPHPAARRSVALRPGAGERAAAPEVFHDAVAHPRAGLLEGVEHAGQRLRRSLQAPDRTRGDDFAQHDVRQHEHHQARRLRLHLRRHDARHLRPDQPLPGQAPHRRHDEERRADDPHAGIPQRHGAAVLLHEPERQPVSTATTAAASSAVRRATTRRSRWPCARARPSDSTPRCAWNTARRKTRSKRFPPMAPCSSVRG